MSVRAKRTSKAKPAIKRLFDSYMSMENEVSTDQALEDANETPPPPDPRRGAIMI